MNRRQFLQTFGVGIGASALAVAPLAQALAALPEGVLAPAAVDPAAHAIARLTFGVTPNLFAHVRQIGAAAFIAEQLAPEALDDSAADEAMQPYVEVLSQNGGILLQSYGGMRQIVSGALLGSWMVHSVYSQRQLYERMVQFFSNHFHEYIGKEFVLFLKVDDERDVIRPNALTNFRQLLGASAHSPAMLLFLDNAESGKDVPNENYARELMELHTLSVDGGYTEADVKEVARCLTGWSIDRPRDNTDGSIHYRFRRGIARQRGENRAGHEHSARRRGAGWRNRARFAGGPSIDREIHQQQNRAALCQRCTAGYAGRANGGRRFSRAAATFMSY